MNPAYFIVASVVVAALILGVRGIYLQGYSAGFVKGVTVNGTSLHGYSYEDGKALIEQLAHERLQVNSYRLTYEDMEWTFTAGDLGAQMDASEQIALAWNFGHVGSWGERRAQMQQLTANPIELNAEIHYDEAALEAFVEEIRAAIDIEARDAETIPDANQQFTIVRESDGRKLDVAGLKALLTETILEGNDPVIDLDARGLVHVVKPNVTVDDAQLQSGASYSATTSFKGSSDNRIKNIKRALQPFNGMVVQNGEAISFNAITGKRTLENGFHTADEFLNGEVVAGVGGGTCQASTTLYQALLKADILVEQRSNHGMTVTYAEPSQDAAVLDTGKVKDLVFTNLTGAPIYIYVDFTDTKVKVTIYRSPMDYEVQLNSVVVSSKKQGKIKRNDTAGKYVKYTDEEYIIEEGRPSITSYLERIYIDKNTGEELRRERSGEDFYMAKRDKVYVGIIDRETGLVVE